MKHGEERRGRRSEGYKGVETRFEGGRYRGECGEVRKSGEGGGVIDEGEGMSDEGGEMRDEG